MSRWEWHLPLLFDQVPGAFLHRLSLDHHLMPTAHAFQAKIGSYPKNFPFLASAGMGFFQLHDIANFIVPSLIHCLHPLFVFFQLRLLALTVVSRPESCAKTYASNPSSLPRISSMSASSFSEKSRRFRAATLSSNCATLLAPIRTLVTSGRRSTHASAI